MNILLLSAQKPDNTGSGVFLKELARSFAAAGHRVCIVAGIAAEDEFSFPAGIDFHPVRFETDALPFPVVGMSDEMPYRATRYRDLDAGMLRAFYAAFDAALDKVLAEFEPDIVFSNHLYVLTAHVVERSLGVPVVGMCHGSEIRQIRKNPLERAAIRRGVRGLAGIMALHAAQKADIVAEYGVPEALVQVTGTGYNREVFCLDSADPQCRGERGQSLVFAGKVTAAKGVRSLLRSLELLDDAAGVRLNMAGGYATLAEYEDIQAQAQAGSAQVVFPGRLTQTALAEAYRASDVFVLPSFYEGLPLVVVEALACGCKVVVTDLPGIGPWLEANLPGAPVWYVEPPAMRNVDEPEPDALPAFEQRLAAALAEAFAAPWTYCDVTGLSWDALARRALEVTA
ncbi:MAG: glycosyltransferase family 4 protein [Coriobacteriia bacterium]|nr:glycosyltransferase family 4 protein [Coriobacteriia bacterium]